jgi:hypothetical protein
MSFRGPLPAECMRPLPKIVVVFDLWDSKHQWYQADTGLQEMPSLPKQDLRAEGHASAVTVR